MATAAKIQYTFVQSHAGFSYFPGDTTDALSEKQVQELLKGGYIVAAGNKADEKADKKD